MGLKLILKLKKIKMKLKFLQQDLTQFLELVLALSIDHPLSKNFKDKKDFQKFQEECNKTGTTEEALANAEKIGFDTGLFALHPLIKIKIPIFFANFVLMDYGSGAIFGCPAHDQRILILQKNIN